MYRWTLASGVSFLSVPPMITPVSDILRNPFHVGASNPPWAPIPTERDKPDVWRVPQLTAHPQETTGGTSI